MAFSLADAASRLESAWWRDGDGLALVLAPVAWAYGLAWRVYESAYRRGWLRAERPDVPVIVVGNLIVGGAGKTPTVQAVVRVLRARGWTPGIVSRGHGRAEMSPRLVSRASDADLVGDEPLLLHLRTGAPVVVSADRAAAAHELRKRHPAVDVIVSDDGAQHLALARDLTVLVFDERGAGNGRLLPAGPLRQPMGKRPPPDTLVLYSAGAPSTPWRGVGARRALAGAVDLASWWRGGSASPEALAALRGRRVVAVAGTAVPERFFSMLEGAGLEIERCPLPDHHRYHTLPWSAADDDVIVTEKDAVKLKPERMLAGTTRVWVAPLDFEPEPSFADTLARRLGRPGAAP